jgi:choline dehydrogenase-like flavoprotein
MKSIVVVGSGASGVHFALSALIKGHFVTMVDYGQSRRQQVTPDVNFDLLKERLADPVEYFLGNSLEGLLLPNPEKQEYYGIPPHKQYIFEKPPDFRFSADGFSPMFSFAQGGLAEAWTGGCYPFNQSEFVDFPFGFEEIAPCYGEVARRIGVTGAADDLSQFLPLHDHLLEPLKLDRHSEVLLHAYERKRRVLNEGLGCFLGRTRVATMSREQNGRKACDYSGRCLWGCPKEALYTPSQTLRECQQYSNFTYVPNVEAQFFKVNTEGRATALVLKQADSGLRHEIPSDYIVLAAGTLCSSKILLRSVYEATGRIVRLPGLMDNRQLLVPFLNLRMFGRTFKTDSYQYHLLGMGIKSDIPTEYVHCQITTLKSALMHPIIQQLPLDLRSATAVAQASHASLGVVNVNFHDSRRPENVVTLTPAQGSLPPTELAIRYVPPTDESERIRRAMQRLKKALRALGCIVPPGMTHTRPMGSSVHYSGTLPMSNQRKPWTTDANCRSHDFENVYFVDGSAFPFLPAKNLTFTLMANAVRVADSAF